MSNGRKVSTDALETLGTIIDDTQKRDAIHLAVLPMVAGCRLYAGQDIRVVDGVAITSVGECTGIVDPFLKVPVQPGQHFWMVLYPRMVTSLRHVWSHPEFSDEIGVVGAESKRDDTRAAVQWLTSFASDTDLRYSELLDAAVEYLDHGDYLCDGGKWEGQDVPDEFWVHFETVTGRKVNEDDRGSFFSCSC